MSRRSQSKRMRFNHWQRVRRAVERNARKNSGRRGFVGLVYHDAAAGLRAMFADEPPISLMQPRLTTFLGPWCCEKGMALHVRVCPDCAEIERRKGGAA